MTQKTLYISDLDGTLLNSHSVLSDFTITKLNTLQHDYNCLFTIATARTPATVTQLMKKVKTTLPYIVMAGAALWDNRRQTFEDIQVISEQVIQQLLSVYEGHQVHPFIYRCHGNCIHAYHVPAMTPDEQEFIRFRLTSPLKKLFTPDELEATSPDSAMLIMSMGHYNELRAIANKIDDQHIACTYMCYHDIFDHEKGFLEIYAHGTTKAAAIRRMAKQTGANRIVVFGDNLNDIPMMQMADHSVAVGNAFNEVKAFANEVIDINDKDAVPLWIEQDLKKK